MKYNKILHKIVPIINSKFLYNFWIFLNKLSLLGLGFNFPIQNKHVAPLLINRSSLVIFDVGAATGGFYETVGVPQNLINGVHFFEPSLASLDVLKEKFSNQSNKFINSVGVSNFIGEGELFDRVENDNSAHATIRKKIIEDYWGSKIKSQKIKIITLESYVYEKNIKKIDYLKINVEREELGVIAGLGKFINNVSYIQFEFGAFNKHTKVSMNDFDLALENFTLFRILYNGGLVQISDEPKFLYGLYARHEILAINNNLIT